MCVVYTGIYDMLSCMLPCVQAALGSLVLDAARELDLTDDIAGDGGAEQTQEDAEEVGEVILTLAVLAILVTAPIGAVGIFVTGPRWLEREQEGKVVAVVLQDTDESDAVTNQTSSHVEGDI